MFVKLPPWGGMKEVKMLPFSSETLKIVGKLLICPYEELPSACGDPFLPRATWTQLRLKYHPSIRIFTSLRRGQCRVQSTSELN
jgi:hypothetical protein